MRQQGNFLVLYLIPAEDSGHTRGPRPCPRGCSSRSAWWCDEPSAESMNSLTRTGSRTPSGQTQPCPLGREVKMYLSQMQYMTEWPQVWIMCSYTYRHNGSCRGLKRSLVYRCTWSFLWCWDIQRAYRAQAAGTHWHLWNMQCVSHGLSRTFSLWKYHEVMFFHCQELFLKLTINPSAKLTSTSINYSFGVMHLILTKPSCLRWLKTLEVIYTSKGDTLLQ